MEAGDTPTPGDKEGASGGAGQNVAAKIRQNKWVVKIRFLCEHIGIYHSLISEKI